MPPTDDDPRSPDADPSADALTDRVAELEATVERQEAAIEALRGYVGAIRAVNEEVERRADLALATARETDDHAGDHDPDPAVAAAVPDRPESDAEAESGSTADDGTGDVRAALSRLRDAL